MSAAVIHTSDSLYRGGVFAFRWGGAAEPGRWMQSISFPGGHIHMQCVVDDFGNLVPVEIAAMLPTRIVEYAERLQ